MRRVVLPLALLLACDPGAAAPPATRAPTAAARPSSSPAPSGPVASDRSPETPEPAPTPAASGGPPAPPVDAPDLPPISRYTWLLEQEAEPVERPRLAAAIAPPAGAHRASLPADSFGAWLRGLPLLPEGTQVHLYNGALKDNQRAQHRVVDLDVGDKDLQQCADAVMRLRVEYLWSAGLRDQVRFKLTDGTPWDLPSYLDGVRIKLVGKKAERTPGAPRPATRETLRGYLRTLFNYAGTASLGAELPRRELAALAPGDVLVQGGFPGHAVLVLDLAEGPGGERYFLLGQSYMPAQQFHILKNPDDPGLSPWYRADALSAGVMTPEWGPFTDRDLRRFRD